MDRASLEVLVGEGYITPEDAKRAEEFGQTHDADPVGYLLSQGIITETLLGQALAEGFKLPYTDLGEAGAIIDSEQMPVPLMAKHRAVLFQEDEKHVFIATDNPAKKRLQETLEKLFPTKKLVLSYTLSRSIDDFLKHHRNALSKRLLKIIDENQHIAPEILQEIMNDAVIFMASDVHFEPQEKDEVIIRFRIDGVLHEVGMISKQYYANIINRIKVQSHLRIDEHYTTQDGSMRITGEQGVVDVRVSVVPTIEGEKVTMRLLGSYVKGLSLNELGLSVQDQVMIENAAKKPFGMILICGPTGSGKTTTLYTLIKMLNKPEINITTIEDPVEYRISRMNQIQVNPETNVTFARGLRSIVRQDPDIILVGEIRDTETAEISVNAALTGHLLFSTFHANDAATAIPRLLDMGTEPFLLASTLEVVGAQRLVRCICRSCRYSVSVEQSELIKLFPTAKTYFPKKSVTLYKSKGCASCNFTGYKGRTAVFEFITINDVLRDIILKSPSRQEIWEVARRNGSRTLFEDGIDKVLSGVTTIEELLRIASPPEPLK